MQTLSKVCRHGVNGTRIRAVGVQQAGMLSQGNQEHLHLLGVVAVSWAQDKGRQGARSCLLTQGMPALLQPQAQAHTSEEALWLFQNTGKIILNALERTVLLFFSSKIKWICMYYRDNMIKTQYL